MLKKNYSKTGNFCRTTFKLPPETHAKTAELCGDFNNWQPNGKFMKRLKNGGFSVTVSLSANRAYRFRYLLDGERWDNDWEADAYIPNEFGSEDSVVKV
ncbi:MAG: isoamylase early set domain-containing protein [Deltaproteobacteria bacterium]|nr:isoamylase early set domain-containing protein [Deltaproteobacteria bacterium]MBW1914989.1 isoamylase early set domain-containing protein [Deltaproteobacteria bacterium]